MTENTFSTHFAPEVANGVAVQANEFVDPVITGINPMLVTLDETGTAPEPFIAPPSPNGVDVGGNVIRYPLAEGFDLDYSVESTEVKQTLILREVPVVPDTAEYFGISEGIRMPAGYAFTPERPNSVQRSSRRKKTSKSATSKQENSSLRFLLQKSWKPKAVLLTSGRSSFR